MNIRFYTLIACLLITVFSYSHPLHNHQKNEVSNANCIMTLQRKNYCSTTKEAFCGTGLMLTGCALIAISAACSQEHCSGNGKGFGIVAGVSALCAGIPCLKRAITSKVVQETENSNA